MKGREGEKKERAVAKAPRGRCRSIKLLLLLLLLLRANMPPTITVLKHSRHHLIVTYQFELTDECQSAKDLLKGLEEEGPFQVIPAFALNKTVTFEFHEAENSISKIKGGKWISSVEMTPQVHHGSWLTLFHGYQLRPVSTAKGCNDMERALFLQTSWLGLWWMANVVVAQPAIAGNGGLQYHY